MNEGLSTMQVFPALGMPSVIPPGSDDLRRGLHPAEGHPSATSSTAPACIETGWPYSRCLSRHVIGWILFIRWRYRLVQRLQ